MCVGRIQLLGLDEIKWEKIDHYNIMFWTIWTMRVMICNDTKYTRLYRTKRFITIIWQKNSIT